MTGSGDPSIIGAAVVNAYLDHALEGATRPAVDLTLDLLDRGVPEELIIRDLLAAAQREVGERWHRNLLGVADEHVATSVADSALHALANADLRPTTTGLVVVACAEGEWHAIAARMFAEQLRARGVAVVFLGASTPAEHVGGFLGRHAPEALAVSCSLPLHLSGVARLCSVAHLHSVPVIAGGRAFAGHPARATVLGVDAFAADVDQATATLETWRHNPPGTPTDDVVLRPDAIELDIRAEQIGVAALASLEDRFPPVSNYDDRQMARTKEDLVYIVQFVAAAILVEDPDLFTVFLDWLVELLDARGVPALAVVASLEALQPLVQLISTAAGELVREGLAHLG